jgi:putative MATE family efflux protein
MKRDLTKGNIFSNLMFMSIPAILGHLAKSFYDIVDMFWIGRISPSAVAGVTVFSSILFFIWVLSSVIGTSSVSMISQSFGAKNEKRAKEVIEQAISFKVLVAIFTMAVVWPFLPRIIEFISDDPTVISNALSYGYVRLAFLPILFAAATMNTALMCVGNSQKAMTIMISTALLNIVLDPIMMFETIPFIGISGLGLGVVGAAWATNIANLVAVSLGLFFLISGRANIKIRFRGLFRLIPEIDKKLLTIGAPLGLEMLSREGANLIAIKIMALYGTSAIASVGVTFRLIGLSFMIMMGLGDGAGAIIGQNLGKRQIKRAEDTAKLTAKISASINAIVFIFVLFFAKNIIGVFTDSAEVIYYGSILIKAMTFSMMFFSYSFGLSSAFFGSGYNKPFMVASVISRWAVQMPALFMVAVVFELPFVAAAIAFAVAELSEGIIMTAFYYKGKWKEMQVVAH